MEDWQDEEVDDCTIWNEGAAFGEANLQEYKRRLISLPDLSIENVGDFLCPALTTEVLGLLEVIRKASDPETAVDWFACFLSSLREAMRQQGTFVQMDFTLVRKD